MALLAEQIVQEWLTRQGYFTMRGLKIGVHEIDLLAAKHVGEGKWHHQHVEVQVSSRPVGYISGKTAKSRPPEQIKATVESWVQKKFNHPDKEKLRNRLSNTTDWEFLFIYGVVRSDEEINLINKLGIKTISIEHVLDELINPKESCGFTTYAGTDILEIMGLWNSFKATSR